MILEHVAARQVGASLCTSALCSPAKLILCIEWARARHFCAVDAQALTLIPYRRFLQTLVPASQSFAPSICHVQGTVLIRNAEELQSYSRGEEERMEASIRGISEAGVGVVVSGAAIGEMAMHFVDKFKMMAIRIPSKFDLRRFCRSIDPALPERDESCPVLASCVAECCITRQSKRTPKTTFWDVLTMT